jgi:hypothetical protein
VSRKKRIWREPLPPELKKLTGTRHYVYRCSSGKRRYRSRDATYMELLRLQELPPEKGTKGHAGFYRCDECAGWHLTSQPIERHNEGGKVGAR